MKIHYLLCGLTRTYKEVIQKLNVIFSKYDIKYYVMDDPSLNDYFDKSFLKKYNYHIVNFNFNEFKDHIIQKYGKQYKFTKIDIQFYKVYYLFNTITDYGDGDIIIRGRTDFFPVFNNSGLFNKKIPCKGWKSSRNCDINSDIIIDNDYLLDNYDINKYIYNIGQDYNEHPYKYMFDGWFMGNIDNMRIFTKCGIKYDNRYYNSSWSWKNGNPPEAQLLNNLLDNNIKLNTICNNSSCIKIF